jgi:hypothetical protein
MPNDQLLQETLRHIRAHPDDWYQADYRRGGCGCFAFHAALLAGAELASPARTATWSPSGKPWPNHDLRLILNGAARDLGFGEGDPIDVAGFARRALGIDRRQAEALFAAANSLTDLDQLVAEYTAAPVTDPADER